MHFIAGVVYSLYVLKCPILENVNSAADFKYTYESKFQIKLTGVRSIWVL